MAGVRDQSTPLRSLEPSWLSQTKGVCVVHLALPLQIQNQAIDPVLKTHILTFPALSESLGMALGLSVRGSPSVHSSSSLVSNISAMLRQTAPGQSEWLPGVRRSTIGSTSAIRPSPTPSFPRVLEALTEQALPEREDTVDEGF